LHKEWVRWIYEEEKREKKVNWDTENEMIPAGKMTMEKYMKSVESLKLFAFHHSNAAFFMQDHRK
jgi:hypothetical protein